MSTPRTPTKAKASARQPPLPPPSGQVYTSTPVKRSLQGSEHYASLSKPDAELLKKNMASELADQWVGPMPVRDFISTFLPNASAQPKFDPNFFSVLAKQEHESEMYEPFIKHVTNNAPKEIEGFKLINTSQFEDRNIDIAGMKNKPDVSCYKKTCSVNPKRPTRYEDIQLIFEFKPSRDKADPFEDNPRRAERGNRFPFEPQADSRRQCRGQIACYARVWSARQHRTHCFIVWIGDPYARIIRFDRSGGIVSAKFDYRKNGDILLSFLWSFSHSNDGARGLDETVTKASPTEADRARKALSNWRPTSYRSVFKVQVPVPVPDPKVDQKNIQKNTWPFFVWAPLADPRSVTGRATRGYPAWDPEDNGGEGRVVFLKDSWRSCEPGMEKEVDILRELNRNQCRNVPELVCGDDLDNQTTITKKYANKPWNIGAKADKFVQRVHTRFVEKSVGSHLTSASQMAKMNSKTFLRVVFDAFIGHYDAYVRCGILHRDVSAGNILVNEDGCGFLNDWDLSKHIQNTAARQVFRSGTWQFMAAELLMDPAIHNTLEHDLESFFWVIVFHILCYMRHSILTDDLQEIVKNIFDSHTEASYGRIPQGGHYKYTVLTGGKKSPLGDFKVSDNKALTSFFLETLLFFNKWYHHTGSHEANVAHYAHDHNISLEVANTTLPLNTVDFAVNDHRAMFQLFTKTLANEDQWPDPETDLFVDCLKPPQSPKRSFQESDGQHAGTDVPVSGASSDSSTERPKKKKKRNDEAEYKGRRGKPFSPRATRRQTKLRESDVRSSRSRRS